MTGFSYVYKLIPIETTDGQCKRFLPCTTNIFG